VQVRKYREVTKVWHRGAIINIVVQQKMSIAVKSKYREVTKDGIVVKWKYREATKDGIAVNTGIW
jgi:hypothetical protein